MARVQNAKRVQAKLLKLAAKAQKDDRISVIVGYNAEYAVFVHENKEMKWKGLKRTGKNPKGFQRKGRYWDPQGRGQSQFLIQPFREKERELAKVVEAGYRKTGSLILGLFLAGSHLQKLSEKLVPVDSGNLKTSAFTEIEK